MSWLFPATDAGLTWPTRRQHLHHSTSKPPCVELRQLSLVLARVGVLSIRGLRRMVILPTRFGPKHHEDPRARAGERIPFVVCGDDGLSSVPVVPCARIRDYAGHAFYVPLSSTISRHPHHVGRQILTVRPIQQTTLCFRGPPETSPSRRRHQHHDAYLADVIIEGGPQRVATRI